MCISMYMVTKNKNVGGGVCEKNLMVQGGPTPNVAGGHEKIGVGEIFHSDSP